MIESEERRFSFLQRVQMILAPRKMTIIRLFVLDEILLALAVTAIILFVPTNPVTLSALAQVGRKFGTLSAFFLCIALTPGILKRFRLFPEIRVILMMFRRHFGIHTYLFAVVHSIFLYWLPGLRLGFTSLLLFEQFGLIAVLLATPLFLTSNDASVRLLGKWWDRIHKLVYLMLFFAALHTLFTSFKIGILLMGVVGLEILSYLVQYIHDHDSPRGQ